MDVADQAWFFFAFVPPIVQSLQRFMRANDWQHDPLAHGNAGAQVAARYDLITGHASAGGATDAKLTSSALLKQGSVIAVCGPTNVVQPAFTVSLPR